MKHLGDITQIDWSAVEAVDVVTGGSPCQGLSVAGKRKGLADERSGLFMEQIRCIKELRQKDERAGRTGVHVRPRFMVWENVPGAFSSGNPKGSDFAAVLEEIVKIVEPEAPAVSVPDKGWPTAGCLYDELGRWSVAWRVHDAQFWGVPQRRKRIALVADFGGLAAPEVLFIRQSVSGYSESCGEARKETAGAVGGGAESASRDRVYCLQGNGIDRADTAGCNGKGWREDVSYTLNTIDRPAVAGALCARDYKGVGNQYVAENKLVIDGPRWRAWGGEDVCPTLTANNAGGGQRMPDKSNFNAATNGSAVRRLTPLECERLQGFPDGWTDIGDWIDSKGKQRKCSDAARYKALGNSIALPFWRWLARRICALYERDVTMGSLFDGIGGFPLVFRQVGATPVWASEIEEFPMAVTKERFKHE